MSPNQPKTPITSFRLDEETKDRLKRVSEQMEVSMTEAVKRCVAAMTTFTEAVRAADPAWAAMVDAQAEVSRKADIRSELSDAARDGLAEYLLQRDWPSDYEEPRRISPSRRWEYSCQAAAILGGEAWAIRKAWPEIAV